MEEATDALLVWFQEGVQMGTVHIYQLYLHYLLFIVEDDKLLGFADPFEEVEGDVSGGVKGTYLFKAFIIYSDLRPIDQQSFA